MVIASEIVNNTILDGTTQMAQPMADGLPLFGNAVQEIPEPAAPQAAPGQKTDSRSTGLVDNSREKQAAMRSAADKLKGILLPPSFAGFGAAFAPALARFGRPENNCWFRVHMTVSFDVLGFKGQDRTLFVADPFNQELQTFLASRNAARPIRCYPYLYNGGGLGFWPVLTAGARGRQLDSWNQSAHLIAEQAKKSWRAIITGTDCYKTASLPSGLDSGEPHWPDSLEEKFLHAIEGVHVKDLSHPEMVRWLKLQ